MSVQDDKGTDRAERADEDDKGTKDDRQSSRAANADQTNQGDDEQRMTEKPEPDEDDKKKAAEMMEAYKEKPTIVLPGTGGSVSGTAVNDWLDDDGNPKNETPEGAENQPKGDDGGRDEEALKEQIEKDKALNERLREAAKEENKGEEGPKGKKGAKDEQGAKDEEGATSEEGAKSEEGARSEKEAEGEKA